MWRQTCTLLNQSEQLLDVRVFIVQNVLRESEVTCRATPLERAQISRLSRVRGSGRRFVGFRRKITNEWPEYHPPTPDGSTLAN